MPNLLNGIQCDNFEWRGKDSVEFSLTCTYDEAASIRAPLVVTDGGETVASFEGMEPMGVWSSGESFRLRASRELTDQAEQAIHALETNLTALTSKVGTVEQDVADVSAASADTLQAVGELGVDSAALQQSTAEILQAIGELGAMVAAMSADAPTEPTE